MNLVFIALTIRAATSLLYATLGTIITERCGIVNLGVEGIMLTGALFGFVGAFYTESVLIGFVCAAVAGALLTLIHAFFAITVRANQIVSGLSLFFFGLGFSEFLGEKLGEGGSSLVGKLGPQIETFEIPLLSNIPYLGPTLFNQDLATYCVYVLVIALWYMLYFTKPGLNIRAVGDNPKAADTMGVSVYKVRYITTILGGALIAIGGAHLSLAYTPGWNANMVSGRGWIAIALVVFAMWNPLRAVVGVMLFGGLSAFQYVLQIQGVPIPPSVLKMTPYIAAIVVLVLVTIRERKKPQHAAPASLGVPYKRDG